MEQVKSVTIPLPFEAEPADQKKGSSIVPGCRQNWRLIIAVIIISTFRMGFGGLEAYIAPAIPNLNAHRNPFHMTGEESSWAGGLTGLGMMIAGPVTGTASDILGRKLAMMTSTLFIVIGLTMITAATEANLMYAGIFISSCFVTINATASMLYLAEVSPIAIRGACTSITLLGASMGTMLIYAVGIVLPWNWLAIFLAAIYAIPTIILTFLPESPYWFTLRGNREAAIHGIQWMQGKCHDVQIRALELSVQKESVKSGWSGWWDLVAIAEYRKSLIICTLLHTLKGFSGIHPMQVFTVSIFQLAGSTTLDPNLQAIIFGLASVVGSLVCSLIINCVGRKTLLISSAVVMCFSMAITGVFFQMLMTNPNYAQQKLFWLPLVGLSLANFGFSVGLLPVPYIITCEMFPTRSRGNAQAVASVFLGLTTFACMKTFINLQAWIHTSGAFYVYACVCGATALFVALTLEERKPEARQHREVSFNSERFHQLLVDLQSQQSISNKMKAKQNLADSKGFIPVVDIAKQAHDTNVRP